MALNRLFPYPLLPPRVSTHASPCSLPLSTPPWKGEWESAHRHFVLEMLLQHGPVRICTHPAELLAPPSEFLASPSELSTSPGELLASWLSLRRAKQPTAPGGSHPRPTITHTRRYPSPPLCGPQRRLPLDVSDRPPPHPAPSVTKHLLRMTRLPAVPRESAHTSACPPVSSRLEIASAFLQALRGDSLGSHAPWEHPCTPNGALPCSKGCPTARVPHSTGIRLKAVFACVTPIHHTRLSPAHHASPPKRVRAHAPCKRVREFIPRASSWAWRYAFEGVRQGVCAPAPPAISGRLPTGASEPCSQAVGS
jgi:hypothetical protein